MYTHINKYIYTGASWLRRRPSIRQLVGFTPAGVAGRSSDRLDVRPPDVRGSRTRTSTPGPLALGSATRLLQAAYS
eukprot:scaffold182333_cov18-Prasinocladus_malaysianus.AAC.1